MTCLQNPSRTCLFACLLLACSGREQTQDGGEDETGDAPADASDDSCMAASTMQLTVADDNADNDEFVQVSPCVVTAVDHDPNDASRWTFVLDCLTEVTVELRTDPPLDSLPFAVGEELQSHISDGASFQMVELEGMDGPLMALLDTSGPAGMIDQPTFGASPFEFEWLAVDDCTTNDVECGVVSQLRIDASAGAEPLILEPEQRYGMLTGATPDERYGLWIGDSWTGDCDGEVHQTLRYAVVALP